MSSRCALAFLFDVQNCCLWLTHTFHLCAVLAHTEEALRVPDALQYLLTEANVTTDVPQLKFLSRWEHPPIREALRVLTPRFGSNPAVVRWAGDVLAARPPREVLFYLPQLVQALRWDSSGAVLEYLAAASRSNVLIAHQTLWCTSAYTEAAEEPTFVQRVVALQLRVKTEMTEAGRRKWAEESGFFESVTAISGVLQPLLGQEGKIRRTLDAELGKLIVKGHLYLPTNPDTRVVGIDAASSAPMKSHAKGEGFPLLFF